MWSRYPALQRMIALRNKISIERCDMPTFWVPFKSGKDLAYFMPVSSMSSPQIYYGAPGSPVHCISPSEVTAAAYVVPLFLWLIAPHSQRSLSSSWRIRSRIWGGKEARGHARCELYSFCLHIPRIAVSSMCILDSG